VVAQGHQLLEAILAIGTSVGSVGGSIEAMVVGVMSITAMAAAGMATAGLRLPCTLPTGRVGIIIPPTRTAGTTLPTGTAGTTLLPTGTLGTTTKAGVAGATRRLLMVVVGRGGTDRFHRIGCQKGATVEAAGWVAVDMTGNVEVFSPPVAAAAMAAYGSRSSGDMVRLLPVAVYLVYCLPAYVDLVKTSV